MKSFSMIKQNNHTFSMRFFLRFSAALLFILLQNILALNYAKATETKDWYSWMDLMPPGPHSLHVVGSVYASNPGMEAYLSVREPQGDDPNILLLDLHLVQKYEVVATVMTWIQVKFNEVVISNSQRYSDVEIYFDDELIADVPVEEVY